MNEQYCLEEEIDNLPHSLNHPPEGYRLHSVIHLGYYSYKHHYHVIWEKKE